jgi:hypothetical protein
MITLKQTILRSFLVLAMTATIPMVQADDSSTAAPQPPTAAQKAARRAAHKAAFQAALANVKSSCQADFQDRCSEFLPAPGQRPDKGLFSCIKQNEAAFSDSCQSALAAMKKLHHHHHHHHHHSQPAPVSSGSGS